MIVFQCLISWQSGNKRHRDLSHTITKEICDPNVRLTESQKSSFKASFIIEREMLDDHISGTGTS